MFGDASLDSVDDQLRALRMTRCWSYAFSSTTISANRFTDMPWSSWNRFVHNNKKIMWVILTETLDCYLAFLKACGWSGHNFAASTSPRPSTNKNGQCRPLPLFIAGSKIPHAGHLSSYGLRHSWWTQFGAFCLNQPVQ